MSQLIEKATFGGGCFWCMQSPFNKLDGVLQVVSGYAGGNGEEPTYQDYAQKGYVEVVQITYNPAIITYEKLLTIFWRQIDPTDLQGQFVDRGAQYRSVIFYHNTEQKKQAEESKKRLQLSGKFSKQILTEILKVENFFPAEEYHQNYDKKNPSEYASYRLNSGRDQFINRVWGEDQSEYVSNKDKKFSDEELRKKLTPLQYAVTQNNNTEPPFANEYWNNDKAGIYVDRVSNEPLFSSLDKFDSGTGWPSFMKTLELRAIIEQKDSSLTTSRTEVRSKESNCHLGHVFPDGPAPTGLRYCMNSAALRFIPVEDLEKEGFGKYKKLFE